MCRAAMKRMLESRLLETLSEDELASLRREAETELAEPADGARPSP
jgi:hypothetical protein